MSFTDADLLVQIPLMERYARRLRRDASDDLVQETLARALAKRALFRPDTDLRAWLFTMLHNQYVNEVRRSHREGVSVELSEDHPAISAHVGYHRVLLRETLREMRRLSQDKRSVLIEAMDGATYDEMAEDADVPVGTIRSRLSRGRAALDAAVEGRREILDQDEENLLRRWK